MITGRLFYDISRENRSGRHLPNGCRSNDEKQEQIKGGKQAEEDCVLITPPGGGVGAELDQ